MQISSLKLHNFTNHKDTYLELPDSGIVLVTGENGGGKSSCIEAVAYALGGKTIRGTDPWQDGVDGYIEVQARPNLHIKRSATKSGSKKLQLLHLDKQYESTTKAKEEFAKEIGDFLVWKRTHVFSSQDADDWSTATDAERKEMLEYILGLSVFDSAYKEAIDRRATHAAQLQSAMTIHREADIQYRSTKQSMDNFRAAPAEPEPKVIPSPDLGVARGIVFQSEEKLNAKIAELSNINSAWQTELEAKVRAIHTARASLNEWQKKLALARAGKCTHCEQLYSVPVQDVEAGLRAAMDNDHQAQLDEAKVRESRQAAERALQEEIRQLHGSLKREQEALSRLQEQQRQAQASQRDHAQWKSRQQALSAYEKRLVGQLAVAADRLDEAEETLNATKDKVAYYDAMLSILGMRGVRAQMLGEALSGIESIANTWLTRFAKPGVQLRLRPYTERKSGAVADLISMDIEGIGGGRGYKATSGGERRRLNIALLLALSEIAAASYGRPQGTMWMDEVFDALHDDEDMDAIIEVLSDLARDRCIVIITHSEAIARRIPKVMHLVADNGTITSKRVP